MKIEEYISSGILEAYVLGELNAEERSSVEKDLMQYPELRKELVEIEEAQERLLMSAAIQPKAGLKERIFEKIEFVKPEAKTVAFESDRSLKFWKLAAAASIAIALLASYLAYDYRSRWRNTASDLSTLIAQNQQIAQDYNQVNDRLNKLEDDLRVKDNPKFTRVFLEGTKNAPDAMAYVYWNESSDEVYLSIQNMKALAKENQYQLWAIIDGKPVDAGVFDGNMAGLVKMKPIGKKPLIFAVTVEPHGGKSSPTLKTMQLMGTVGKG